MAKETPKDTLDSVAVARTLQQVMHAMTEAVSALGSLQSSLASRTAGAQGSDTGVRATETRIEDVAGGEALTVENVDMQRNWHSNRKSVFDGHQENQRLVFEGLRESVKRSSDHIAALQKQEIVGFQEQQKFLTRCGMNALSFDHQLHNQHTAHRDVSTDATWDPGPGEESLKKEE